MSLRGKVILLTPAGTGGIATYARELEKHWTLDEPKIRVWKVPRSNLVGWLLYTPKLVFFIAYLIMSKPKLVHVNLASKGSPIRKYPYVLVTRLFRIKIITQLHSGRFDSDLMSVTSNSIWRIVTKQILGFSEKIIFINRNQMKTLIENRFSTARQSYFLPNHVHLPLLGETRNKFKTFDAVYIGRFSVEKGARELIGALDEMPGDARNIAIVGRIELGGYSAGKEVKIGKHEVTFFGQVPHLNAMEILESSKILLLPSHSENFPMVILEAFARGIPVIATSVGEIPNIIENGKDGWIVGAHDSADLGNKMFVYLNEPKLAIEHGEMARKKAEELYDISLYAEKLKKIYFSES
ncbi:MAG: glycosyltransferase [Actinobacteria bacterium]|nr:glycosyltransferase [Actinomycetota bacterium]